MPVRTLAFSPDSQHLITGSDDQHINLYDLSNTERPLSTLSGHGSWFLCVHFSPDGKRFSSSSSDKTVKIWDLAERQ